MLHFTFNPVARKWVSPRGAVLNAGEVIRAAQKPDGGALRLTTKFGTLEIPASTIYDIDADPDALRILLGFIACGNVRPFSTEE